MNREDKYLNAEGDFEGEVEMPEGGWMQLSREKQTPYIAIPIVVTGDDADAGKRITWAGWLSDKALENTINTLVKCFDFDGDLNSLYSGKQTFDGKSVSFTTEIEEYQGKKRCKVKWLNPAGYVHTPKRIDDVVAQTILAGINKRAKQAAIAAKAEAPTEAPKPKQAPPPPAPDDDVPF